MTDFQQKKILEQILWPWKNINQFKKKHTINCRKQNL